MILYDVTWSPERGDVVGRGFGPGVQRHGGVGFGPGGGDGVGRFGPGRGDVVGRGSGPGRGDVVGRDSGPGHSDGVEISFWGKMGNFLPFCRFLAVWVEICICSRLCMILYFQKLIVLYSND